MTSRMQRAPDERGEPGASVVIGNPALKNLAYENNLPRSRSHRARPSAPTCHQPTTGTAEATAPGLMKAMMSAVRMPATSCSSAPRSSDRRCASSKALARTCAGLSIQTPPRRYRAQLFSARIATQCVARHWPGSVGGAQLREDGVEVFFIAPGECPCGARFYISATCEQPQHGVVAERSTRTARRPDWLPCAVRPVHRRNAWVAPLAPACAAAYQQGRYLQGLGNAYQTCVVARGARASGRRPSTSCTTPRAGAARSTPRRAKQRTIHATDSREAPDRIGLAVRNRDERLIRRPKGPTRSPGA